MSVALKVLPEEIRTIAAGPINNAYTGIGPAFEHPIRIIHIQNLTDTILMFSFDGITDHVALPSNGFLLLDVTTNKTNQAGGMFIAEGTRIYVKEIALSPTAGDVYVSTWYGFSL
jgi:hypothetical protein